MKDYSWKEYKLACNQYIKGHWNYNDLKNFAENNKKFWPKINKYIHYTKKFQRHWKYQQCYRNKKILALLEGPDFITIDFKKFSLPLIKNIFNDLVVVDIQPMVFPLIKNDTGK